MRKDEEAVIIVIAGGGSVAVLIGLYKLDALGKLGKYLHTKIFVFERFTRKLPSQTERKTLCFIYL